MLEIDDPLFQEAREIMSVGNSVRAFWGKNNPHNKLMHIRAVIDDDWIVYRWWSYHRRSWQYEIDWIYRFYLAHKYDVLTITRKGRQRSDK